MGEHADDVLNGLVCKNYDDWFHDGEETGHPRSCCHDVLSDAPKDGRGNLFAVIKLPLKWKPYSPKSQEFKRGIKGRWQIWNGYGFENADVEAIDGWEDKNAMSYEDPHDIESGRLWNPIETAPKDGTKIDLLLNGKSRVPDCIWSKEDGAWIDDHIRAFVVLPDDPMNKITHWMFAPPAPSEEVKP